MPSLNEELCKACETGFLPEIQALIQRGANAQYKKGKALCIAAGGGHIEAMQYLISLGVDLHTQQDEPLEWAAWNGQHPAVQWLISQGACVNKVVERLSQDPFAEEQLTTLGYLRSLQEQTLLKQELPSQKKTLIRSRL